MEKALGSRCLESCTANSNATLFLWSESVIRNDNVHIRLPSSNINPLHRLLLCSQEYLLIYQKFMAYYNLIAQSVKGNDFIQFHHYHKKGNYVQIYY